MLPRSGQPVSSDGVLGALSIGPARYAGGVELARAFVMVAIVAAGCGGGGGGSGDDGGGGGDDGPGGDGAHADAMVDAAPAICGDGMRVAGEECDDHNSTPGDGCDATCRIEPYGGAPQSAIDAMHAMNAARARADVPGAHLDSHAVASSQNHATYYATNPGAYPAGVSSHVEDANFPNGFTGVSFGTRMTAAGFSGSPMFETMAFVANPSSAVSGWLNTVFHRIPILHPNMTVFGYGNSTANGRNNDVSDFGSGTAESASKVILWPPPGATGVPRQFNTAQEGPTPPPAPGGGSITGPLVSVLFANGSSGTITAHAIKDATGATLPDTMIAKTDAMFGAFMMGSYCFYAAGPAPSGATFTVEIQGTVNGQPFSRAWSFTTQ
jgi:cysteine-rich repeat protein